ncbi:MAG: S8 family serine peptidase, partial [Candidatus Eisenbacteria bacterium]|nr:S8 family serine peptidase [Candidatus Eisenbacteria bacterium]
MKRPMPIAGRPVLRWCAAAGVLTLALFSSAAWADWESGQVQLELVPGASIEAINARYGSTTLDSLPPLYLLQVPVGGNEDDLLDALLDDPDVEDGEYSYENETPEGTGQMVVTAVGGTIDDYLDQRLAERLHLAEIHEVTIGSGVTVAILDSGILAEHPALEGAVLPDGWDFVADDADPTDSANGLDDDNDGAIDEGAGHGTMIAGIVHLVAPGAKILPIRVLDDEGTGTTFDVAKAIRYATEHGADVINMSFGLTNRSFVIHREIEVADTLQVVMAAAAGNMNLENPQYFPASDSNVLSVAALDSADVKADFSNFHSHVSVSAPGMGVLAPYHDGQYAIGAGTSFATPFISAQSALLLSLFPELESEALWELVRTGVIDIYDIVENEPYIGKLGSGRLDGLALRDALAGNAAVGAGSGSFFAGNAPLVCYPNPGAAGAAIDLRLSKAGRAGIKNGGSAAVRVLDVSGRLLRRLVLRDGAARWDGRDERGRIL